VPYTEAVLSVHHQCADQEQTDIVCGGWHMVAACRYGLCTISADLKSWKKVGTDPRLADNCHGIVVFKHKVLAKPLGVRTSLVSAPEL
jgi:hypothetical protein